jgi:hypothetical protein
VDDLADPALSVAGGCADPRLAHPGQRVQQPEQLADVTAV